MKNKNHKSPKKFIQGRTGTSQDAKVPVARGGKGTIKTNLQDINWTRKKLTLVICALSIPYIIAIVGSINAEKPFITILLILLGMFVGLLAFAVHFIEQNEF